MDKNKKKKAEPSKAAKPASDYKSREGAGKTSPADAAFQKAFGRAKDNSRKG